MSPWRIREIAEEDEDTWADVLALDALEFPPGTWDTPRRSSLFVCEAHTRAGWELAAYASARDLLGDGELGSVYFDRAAVARAYRGRGLQRRLIRRRLEWARARNARVAITYTMAGLAVSANNLIACGFRLYVPEYAWAGTDALYWWRHVGAAPTKRKGA